MSAAVVELHAGGRVWFEGGMYLVQELGPQRTTLAADGRLRSVATAEVVRHATLISDDTDTRDQTAEGEPVNVLLSGLTKEQRATLETRARLMRELLEPDGEDDRSLTSRCEAAAAASGVSGRTLRRWVAGYRRAGLAGLMDSRILSRYTPSVDPRWDAACLTVLREYVSSSTPTMNVIIDRVQRRVEEEHGPDVVVCPPRTTAYRRLGELSKGRHAFGSGKARCSIANRPGGPYGRLRATRPGEYVVLDTTPLDVFAMEPVTLRWVPVELTIAQDLFTRCLLGLRLSPVSTKSADVANVLYQCVTPQPAGTDDGRWPFHGVPAPIRARLNFSPSYHAHAAITRLRRRPGSSPGWWCSGACSFARVQAVSAGRSASPVTGCTATASVPRPTKLKGLKLPRSTSSGSPDVHAALWSSFKEWIHEPTLWRNLADSTVPMRFIAAGGDIRPDWPLWQLARLVPGGAFQLVADAPHDFWATDPELWRTSCAAACDQLR